MTDEPSRKSSDVDPSVGGIAIYVPPLAVSYDYGVLEPEPAFAGWTTFVSHKAVRAIAASSDAQTVWIATWGGVLAWTRFGQHVYRRYSSEHGIAGTPTCIAVSSNDQPWIGHAEGGLSYFEGDRWHPHTWLRNMAVSRIAPVSNGKLWVATPEAIFLVEQNAAPIEILRGNANCSDATALLSDGDGVLVGSPSGLYRVSVQGAVVRQLPDLVVECTALARGKDGTVLIGTANGGVIDHGILLISPEVREPVIAIAPISNGAWVLTANSISRIHNGNWQLMPMRSADVAAPRAIAAVDGDDEYLWIGSDNLMSGLRATGESRYDANFLPAFTEDVLSNIGRCAVGDATGRVWIGTGSGLFVGEPDGTWRFDDSAGDIRSAIISTTASGPEIQMLSWPSTLMRVREGEREWHPASLPGGMVRTLAAGRDGSSHVLVNSSIWRLGSGEPKRISDNVPAGARAIAQSVDDVWFASTERGLFLESAPNTWTHEPQLGSTSISALAYIANTLWAGTDGAMWRRANNAWQRYALEFDGAAVADPITMIASSSTADCLWIACGGRVARYSFKHHQIEISFDRFNSGVCGRDVTAIAETKGILWIVSRSGIARHLLSK